MSHAGFSSEFTAEVKASSWWQRALGFGRRRRRKMFKGQFEITCRNADGSIAWVEKIANGNCNVGLNNNLDAYFGAATQTTTWYLSLVDNSGWTAFAATDTMGAHPGWAEYTSYTEAVRQTWTPGAASGQTITNPTAATFTAGGTVTLKGAFLTSVNTKGGTTGILWATGAFSGTQSLTIGQTIDVKYTVTAS